MALVSVVTPVYNGERYLRDCIESILEQSFHDWEYVIVDNNSTDRSGEIAESYSKDKRIRIFHNCSLLPVTMSFNKAASLVSSDAKYIKYVCADDLLFRHCLEMMVEVAESYPQVTLVGSYKIHGKSAVFEGPPFPVDLVHGKDVCKWFFQGRIGILGSETNHLIRIPGKLSRGGNLFDETFAMHSDTELFIRLLKDGGDFGFVHQVLTATREHNASIGSTKAHVLGSSLVESLAMLIKHGQGFLSTDELSTMERAHRRRYYQFLFRSFLKFEDRGVWKYHVANWSKLGIRMSFSDLAECALWGAVMSVLHPLDSLARLRREYQRMVAGHWPESGDGTKGLAT